MCFKGIIYDFDGVICDSVGVKTEAFALMYSNYGADIVNQVVKHHIENGGISRYEKFKFFHREFLGIDLSEPQIIEMGKTFSNIVLQKVIESDFLLGAFNFIKVNSKKYKQFICTGTPDIEIQHIVKQRNLTSFFEGVFGSPKTKEEIIEIIKQQNNFKNEDLVFFGDAMTDYKAAKYCDISFVGVYSKETSFPLGTNVIRDFEDKILDKLF